jgi:hypothetical protein
LDLIIAATALWSLTIPRTSKTSRSFCSTIHTNENYR